MSSRKLLITGATGKQGGAVIDALLANSWPGQILALTRDPNSAKAKSLASKPNVIIVQGDTKSAGAIFLANRSIDGLFLVTAPGKAGAEEAQAEPMIAEAIKNGVKHIVFSSVDRGGDEKSDSNPTNIEHFASKHRIEESLKLQSATTRTGWTILRPVAFMDNLVPGFMGKGFASMWLGVGDQPLQLVSVHDIGVFAAKAFANPTAYKGKSISLAGDELTLGQAKPIFKDVVGYDLPETYGFVGTGIQYMVKEMGTMFRWFKADGYGADISALREDVKGLQNFATWLADTSEFGKR